MPKGGLRPRSSDGSLEHLIQPKWKLGQTKTIRVPIVIAEQLLEIAHRLDEGASPISDLTHDTKPIKTTQEVLLNAVNNFIELKRAEWGKNPAQKGEFSTTSRAWDVFQQFKQLVEKNPDIL